MIIVQNVFQPEICVKQAIRSGFVRQNVQVVKI
jgi:hypothetical protein